jgi:hypothetical protein
MDAIDEDIFSEEFFREVQAALAAKKLQLEHPYVFDLIMVLARYPIVKPSIAVDWMERNRSALGLPIPPTFRESVQAALNYYCRDSDVFKGRPNALPEDALFCWPKGKRRGWALIKENARAWVRSHRAALKLQG